MSALCFPGLPWIQEIDDKKRKKFLAVALAKQLLEEEVDWSHYTYSSPKDQDQNKTPNKVHSNPLMRAIEMGIPELVEEILRYIPGAANSIDKDGRNVFHYAAEHRAGDIYEKLKVSVVNKDRMLSDVDYKGNTILHYATKIMLSTNLSIGIANLLTWEVFWFQVKNTSTLDNLKCICLFWKHMNAPAEVLRHNFIIVKV